MKKYEICRKYLEGLESNIRIWGSVVDIILSNYKLLPPSKKAELAAETSKVVRFNLMSQYLEHFGRIFYDVTLEEKRALIENSIYLISLDNFEYDYRETILRVTRFLERAKSHELLFESVWSCLKDQIPEHTAKEIRRLRHEQRAIINPG